MKNIGVCGMGINLPIRRLPVEETINTWNNTSVDLVKKQFGVEKRTVLNSDEDVITLSTEAAKNCLYNAGIDSEDIDSIYLGTVTSSELFRGSSNSVMGMLTSNGHYASADIAASERSGTMALSIAWGNVLSGIRKNALVIGADVMSRHTAPGDLRESYEGNGAAAAIIGTKEVIATIEAFDSYNSNFPVIGRPEDERFIRVLSPMDEGILKIGPLNHVRTAISTFFKKNNTAIKDYDYIILPQQYPGQVLSLAKLLEIPNEKVIPTIFSKNTGDTGSASSLIALNKILDIANPKEKILLCSYGHNSGADIISLQVTEHIENYRKKLKRNTKQILEDTMDVNYTVAQKIEYKLVQPEITIGTFM